MHTYMYHSCVYHICIYVYIYILCMIRPCLAFGVSLLGSFVVISGIILCLFRWLKYQSDEGGVLQREL